MAEEEGQPKKVRAMSELDIMVLGTHALSTAEGIGWRFLLMTAV